MVRSGILNSVHAFASDPTRGVFILALLALVIGGSLLLFALRAPALAASGVFAPVSREGALVLNNVLLCSLAAVVLTGTIYPMFASFVFNDKLTVGPPYFHLTVVPLLVPLFAAMSVGPTLPWKRADLLPGLVRLWWAAALAALVGIAAEAGLHNAFAAAGFAASAWLIVGAFAELVERVRLFRIPFAATRARITAQPLAVWGAAIAHAGMGVTVAGIAGMALSTSTIVSMRPGSTVAFGGYDWTLSGLRTAPGPDYTARIGDLRVTRNGRQVALFHPARHTFTAQHQTVSDTAIQTNLLRDLYAVMGDEHDGQVVLRLHVNVLAPWIWLGALVMAAGGGLSLADRRLRVGAPARRGAATVPA
ncbi:MAG TPA: cytochrome c-type biogenesis CcmF C-terminal domain-containing protein, partial [Acetobacteraceae bacterium]|nr:cytochrome c-type biogenesis CcmF C-terminal domain-containing protein [Acetobacteraceae bacterium]